MVEYELKQQQPTTKQNNAFVDIKKKETTKLTSQYKPYLTLCSHRLPHE